MESLKKNLHFAIFGAGILVGLILVGAAWFMKAGKVAALDEAKAALAKNPEAAIPTKGDLDKARGIRAAYDNSLKGAEDALKTGNGAALKRDLRPFTSAQTFYSSEADRLLTDLERRFAALDKPIQYPPELGDRRLPPRGLTGSTSAETYIQRKRKEINNNQDVARIVHFQVELRILQEICCTCEKLLTAEAFRDTGVRIEDVKFEQRIGEATGVEQPWEEFSFIIIMECDPAFPVALAEELSNPSKLTEGSAAKADRDNGLARRLFPVVVDDVQTAMRERPQWAGFNIPLSERANYGIPEKAKASDEQVKQIAANKEVELMKSVNVLLPVDASVRARALNYNSKWKALNPEQQ